MQGEEDESAFSSPEGSLEGIELTNKTPDPRPEQRAAADDSDADEGHTGEGKLTYATQLLVVLLLLFAAIAVTFHDSGIPPSGNVFQVRVETRRCPHSQRLHAARNLVCTLLSVLVSSSNSPSTL